MLSAPSCRSRRWLSPSSPRAARLRLDRPRARRARPRDAQVLAWRAPRGARRSCAWRSSAARRGDPGRGRRRVVVAPRVESAAEAAGARRPAALPAGRPPRVRGPPGRLGAVGARRPSPPAAWSRSSRRRRPTRPRRSRPSTGSTPGRRLRRPRARPDGDARAGSTGVREATPRCRRRGGRGHRLGRRRAGRPLAAARAGRRAVDVAGLRGRRPHLRAAGSTRLASACVARREGSACGA